MQFDTVAVHGAFRSDPATGAISPPIYQTTTYVLNLTAWLVVVFSLSVSLYFTIKVVKTQDHFNAKTQKNI